jgi:outer membrane protein assembly factor BamB
MDLVAEISSSPPRSPEVHGEGARILKALLRSLFLVIGLCSVVCAEDWPQWQGPLRDGIWRETGLFASFPKEGLKILWRMPVAGGYSGPAVAGGRVYVTDFLPGPDTHRPVNPFKRITEPGQERMQCLDQSSGKVLWTDTYDVAYGMSYSAGPRATPTVDHGRVYTFGGEGELRCVDAATGKLIWAKALSDEKHPTPMWGFASAPLVDGDELFCISGGNDPEHGRGVVTAYDKVTGAVIWTALAAKEPGYSAPIIVQAGEVRQLIVWDPVAVNSLDPKTGKSYWSQAFPARMGMSIVTPRFDHDPQLGNVLFVATQYDGSLLLKLADAAPSASILWKRKGKNDRKTDALHIVAWPPVLRDGHIYGVDTYGELRCLDLANGNRLWETFDATTYDAGEQKWASAFLIPLGETGDRYLIANEHGDLILAQMNPAGYHELSRTHLLEPSNSDPGRLVVWCHPALADRCVFWRNDKEIICASLAATAVQ